MTSGTFMNRTRSERRRIVEKTCRTAASIAQRRHRFCTKLAPTLSKGHPQPTASRQDMQMDGTRGVTDVQMDGRGLSAFRLPDIRHPSRLLKRFVLSG